MPTQCVTEFSFAAFCSSNAQCHERCFTEEASLNIHASSVRQEDALELPGFYYPLDAIDCEQFEDPICPATTCCPECATELQTLFKCLIQALPKPERLAISPLWDSCPLTCTKFLVNDDPAAPQGQRPESGKQKQPEQVLIAFNGNLVCDRQTGPESLGFCPVAQCRDPPDGCSFVQEYQPRGPRDNGSYYCCPVKCLSRNDLTQEQCGGEATVADPNQEEQVVAAVAEKEDLEPVPAEDLEPVLVATDTDEVVQQEVVVPVPEVVQQQDVPVQEEEEVAPVLEEPVGRCDRLIGPESRNNRCPIATCMAPRSGCSYVTEYESRDVLDGDALCCKMMCLMRDDTTNAICRRGNGDESNSNSDVGEQEEDLVPVIESIEDLASVLITGSVTDTETTVRPPVVVIPNTSLCSMYNVCTNAGLVDGSCCPTPEGNYLGCCLNVAGVDPTSIIAIVPPQVVGQEVPATASSTSGATTEEDEQPVQENGPDTATTATGTANTNAATVSVADPGVDSVASSGSGSVSGVFGLVDPETSNANSSLGRGEVVKNENGLRVNSNRESYRVSEAEAGNGR